MTIAIGDVLTATPASVTGTPTPSRTWQWLRDGSAISGATSNIYTVISADADALLSVRQIETNLLGAATATSVTLGPVLAFDADALAYIAAVEEQDAEALEAGVKDAINDFVVGCKADGIWGAIKASCILAGARTLNGCLVPLVGAAPTSFNFVTGDYNRKTGLVGNGTTKYLDSNRANNADPQDSKHLACYVTVMGSSTASGSRRFPAFLSADAGSLGASGILRNEANATNLFSRNNCQTSALTAFSTGLGLIAVNRSISTDYALRVDGANTTITQSSETPSLSDVFIFRDSAGISTYNISRMSFYSIGESIDLAALDTRVSALMTAIDGAIT